ncbi:type I restriction enzyme HsdR N-terminal domain-containing protein [Gracilimonas mengyeensis]|uniref:type I restriction enzyme HsdR N-terminal domain-containing protein n=1 Tax=Gracilimonas mengyeensis TaxID=1302730 RepID=UPI00163DCCCE|nr:type I restriction enzyme HsdR N-terminal domain-containing protein [Gracilimonas mengyeensis]
MLSKALAQYPQFRFEQGKKKLWNPILKKAFVNRPEERVRLALVDYLTRKSEVSAHRIAFESPVKLESTANTSRTDLICYNKNFEPLLLAECKAPDIKLDEKAAVQIARYNQEVGAPYLLVSNGTFDFWFQNQDKKATPMPEVPTSFQEQKQPHCDFNYWQQRVFLGEKLQPEIRKFAVKNCIQMFGDAHQPVKYLAFDGFSPELALEHYYRIFAFEKQAKIALTFSANPYGATHINGVLNQGGANTAFVSASLDLLTKAEHPNAEVHSSKGVQTIDLKKEADFSTNMQAAELAQSIQKLLLNYV